MKLLYDYFLLFFILQSCGKSTLPPNKRNIMPLALVGVVRQYHQVFQKYKTNVYLMRFMNRYDSSSFIILPILNKGQMQRARPFRLLKVDSLFILCHTGYEYFDEKSYISPSDSVKMEALIDSFMLPAPFDPIVWQGIILNKDSVLIDKEPKNPYGINPPCEEAQYIKFVPPSKIE